MFARSGEPAPNATHPGAREGPRLVAQEDDATGIVRADLRGRDVASGRAPQDRPVRDDQSGAPFRDRQPA